MTFEKWFSQVSIEMIALIGMGTESIADYLYRDAYDDGESAYDVALAALEADPLVQIFGGLNNLLECECEITHICK